MSGPNTAPTLGSLVTEWRPDYLTGLIAVLAVIGYLRLRKVASADWPVRRDVLFGIGMFSVFWVSCGFLQARSDQFMWAWTTQQLALLLVVPIVVMAGQPIALLRAVRGERAWLLRILDSRPVRILASPLVAPVFVPVLSMLMFFGGLGAWALSSTLTGWIFHMILLILGCLIVLPLVDADDRRSSLAVGVALGVGIVELLIDAFPGIALRFQTHVILSHFTYDRPSWAGTGIDDQHHAGGILWIVAEILDLPFLVLAATKWIKADAREAAVIDAELEAKRPVSAEGGEPTVDRPWWLDDPEMRDRFNR